MKMSNRPRRCSPSCERKGAISLLLQTRPYGRGSMGAVRPIAAAVKASAKESVTHQGMVARQGQPGRQADNEEELHSRRHSDAYQVQLDQANQR